MGHDAPGLARRDPTRHLETPSGGAVPEWPATGLGMVLSAVLGHPTSGEEIRDKAIALGLLRHTGDDQPVALSSQAASRLLLVGYGLPAVAEATKLETLHRQLREGCRVFALIGLPDTPVVEVHGFDSRSTGISILLCSGCVAVLGERMPDRRQMTIEALGASVSAVVMARGWSELANCGCTFFGGIRDPDGTYYWNVAECATDREGRILRCYGS